MGVHPSRVEILVVSGAVARANERLHGALGTIDIVDVEDESPVQQVWAMTGPASIENRTNDDVRDATDEIVLVVDDGSLLTEELVDSRDEVGTGLDRLGSVSTRLPERADRKRTVPKRGFVRRPRYPAIIDNGQVDEGAGVPAL